MKPAHTGKYRALWAMLHARTDDRASMTFAEIEDALGFNLPPSSRNYLAHWYGYKGSAVARAIIDAGWHASQVNLSAETVEFVRGDAADSLTSLLEAREVAAPIMEILLRFAETNAVEHCTAETKLLPLSASHDAYAAVYVGRNDLSIALDWDESQRVNERTGLRLEDKRPTSYIHIRSDQLDDPAIEAEARRLLSRAFERAFHGPRWQRGLSDRSRRRGEMCPRCGVYELSVTGVCAGCD